MSAANDVRRIRAELGHAKPEPDRQAAEELAKLLGLQEIDPPVSITAASVIGEGADAAAYIELDTGAELRFRTLREMTVANKLMAEVVATTGALPKLNQQVAMRAVALLRQCARHVKSMTELDEAIEWLTNYLQAATIIDADFDDQTERWGAFSTLHGIDPRERHRETGISIAAASIVLRHPSGSRLVRTDWVRAYVRSIEPRVTPAQLAVLAQRAGWTRRGKEGRWKATAPGRPGQINLAFWLVPPDWENRGAEAATTQAVTTQATQDHGTPQNTCTDAQTTASVTAGYGTQVTAGEGITPARPGAPARVRAVTSRNQHKDEGERDPAEDLLDHHPTDEDLLDYAERLHADHADQATR